MLYMPDFSTLSQALPVVAVFKYGILIALGIFLVFLFVIFRQVRSMNQILTQTFYGGFLQFVAFLLIFGVLALLLVSLAIL